MVSKIFKIMEGFDDVMSFVFNTLWWALVGVIMLGVVIPIMTIVECVKNKRKLSETYLYGLKCFCEKISLTIRQKS